MKRCIKMKRINRIITMLMLLSLVFTTSAFASAQAADDSTVGSSKVIMTDASPAGNPEVTTPDTTLSESPEAAVRVTAHNHTPGTYVSTTWQVSPKFDQSIYCYYRVRYDNYICATCGTPFLYNTGIEDYATHTKVWDTSSSGVVKGFHCPKCGYYSWK